MAPANEWVHVEQIQSAPSFGVSTEDIVQQGAVLSGEAEKLAQEEVQELQVQSHITEVAITEVPLSLSYEMKVEGFFFRSSSPQTAPPEVAAATLDWATADEDSGLPSIDSLEQQFGKSGAATPNSPFASGAATPAKPPAVSAEPSTNKQTNGIATPVDEWQSTGPRPHGGRGGRGGRYSWGPSVETDTDGFIGTGGRRGGRGARGDYRNGERGRGGFRGGEFGQRGGYRGIERGGYRSGDGRNASRERVSTPQLTPACVSLRIVSRGEMVMRAPVHHLIVTASVAGDAGDEAAIVDETTRTGGEGEVAVDAVSDLRDPLLAEA